MSPAEVSANPATPTLVWALLTAIGALVSALGWAIKKKDDAEKKVDAIQAKLDKEREDCENEKKELNDAFKAELKEHGKAYAALANQSRQTLRDQQGSQ